MTAIHATNIAEALRAQASELYGYWTEEGITTLMDNLKADLIEKTQVNIRVEALQILKEMGPDKKIQAIKELRTRCGLGIKEAKEAIEAALPEYLTAKLLVLAQDLADANYRTTFPNRKWPAKDLVDVKMVARSNLY